MKTKHSLAVALALLITYAHAQRLSFEPRIDLRDRAERAEDQRLEMLRLQREANDELRRQTRAADQWKAMLAKKFDYDPNEKIQADRRRPSLRLRNF